MDEEKILARGAMRGQLLWALRLCLSAGVLGLVLTIVPVREVLLSLRSTRGSLVAAAVLLAVIQTILSARRLKVLTDWQGMGISTAEIAEINFVTGFYGLLLPGDLASGMIRWHRLAGIDRRRGEALAAIVYGRIVSTAAVVSAGAGFLLIDTSRSPPGLFAVLAALLVLLVALWVFAPHARMRAAAGLLPSWLATRMQRLLETMGRFHRLPAASLALVAGCCLLEQAVGVLSLVALARSIDLDVGLVALGWIRSVVILVTLLPISVSGLGVREGSLLALLEPHGVPGTEAVALSFLVFARTLILALLGGALELVRVLAPSRSTDRTD